MPQSRLTTALQEGNLRLPDGDIAVLRPPATTDLSAFDPARLRVSQGFRPDHDHWVAAGLKVVVTPKPAASALIVVPRSKTHARTLVAEACHLAPFVMVDGQKTDGIDSLWRDVRSRIGDVETLTKAHGRIFWFPVTDRFADWTAPEPARGPDGFIRQAGVFSGDGIDPGSALLAAALPWKLPSRMADLGAGWGYLASEVLKHDSVTSLDLIEAEQLALDCARLNITDPRAHFHWADAICFAPGKPIDGIVMNPPFHTSRAADPDLGRAFIRAASRMLTPGGQLWMVANRHLPYDPILTECFKVVEDIGGNPSFRIIHATRPKR
ncbi:MAG: methyltransferase [Rhodobacterales bacterium]|nr:methyltransferase [Rhodobacterales bacterium]